MKSFYRKFILYIALLLLSVVFFFLLSTTDTFRLPIAKLTDSGDYITINNGPDEICPYIDKARDGNNYTKLILGDSVCHQMFTDLQDYNDDICILGSNAAITMIGQYILMREFLDNHDEVSDIWLIIIPSSLSSYIDTYYGYQYIVMPNVEKGTLALLDQPTTKQLENVYGKIFLNPSVVHFLDRSAPSRKVYLNLLSKHGEGYGNAPMSPVSIEYIDKMINLCSEHNVRLHLLSGPVSNARKDIYQDIVTEFKATGLDQQFPNYSRDIMYYPDIQFRDGIHLGGDYANQSSYNEKIKQLADDELLKSLKFE